MNHDSARLAEEAVAEERLGNWSAAVALYDAAYRAAWTGGDAAALLDVVTRLGHCFRQAGEAELAEEHFELVLHLAGHRDDDTYAARALNGLGILKHEHGDIEGAEATYLRAHEAAIRAGHENVIGEIEQNLGITANIRGDLEQALARYLSALDHLRRARNEQACARAYNNLGMLHVDLRRLGEADAYFQSALALCERFNDVVMAGFVHINRAELFLARGEAERARSSCDEAFEIASRLNDGAGRAEALKFYGIIYRETQRPHLAETHLRQAIQAADECRNPLLEAEANRELALVLRAQERNGEALEALNRAHCLFSGLQAKQDQADVGRRISQLETDFLSLVRFWSESIEAKDRYTHGHCDRVAEYACRLAAEVGLPGWELVWFRMGAFLHDVGKTEVPAEILNKAGRLTAEERALMERHPVAGDEMLAAVAFPWDVRSMVRSHHERWDGAGYPDGLAGEAIPQAARILRLADVFDALTTARSYRDPLTPDEALRLMEEDEGSFDPVVFAAFLRIYPEISRHARAACADAGDYGAAATG